MENTETNGRFHTDWLNMIYPRLKLARDLLTDDGLIFISINDCEVDNLIKICNEIFGENNFIVNAIWINGRTSASFFTHAHEYIVGFAKDISKLQFFEYSGESIHISDRTIKKPGIKNPESVIEFPSGIEFDCEDKIFPNKFGNKEPVEIIEGVFECKNRKLANPVKIKAAWTMADMIKDWISGKEVFDQKGQKVVRFYFKENGVLQYEKIKSTVHPNSVISGYSTKLGTNELIALLGVDVFSFPKPSQLIKHLMLNIKDNDIVLDFFSGSASTAHSVMSLNAADNVRRNFIMVQLPAPCEENSPAFKAGYKNICEIGKERIRRAGKKIKEDNADNPDIDKLDIGFRVLKLDSSNIEAVKTSPQETSLDLLKIDNIKPDRTAEDLLFQVMLRLGIELSAEIKTESINDHQVFFVNGTYLAACFERNLKEETLLAIAKAHPQYCVIRDSSSADENIMDNFEAIFKQFSPSTECKLI